jgi:outer membrane protein TolC
VSIANWQVMEAWAPTLPNISAGWRNTWRSNDMGASMGDFQFVTGDRETAVGQIMATVTVVDFGKARWYRDAMRVLRDGTAFDADRAGQSLDLSVTRTYVGVLAATRLTGLAKQTVHLLDRQLEVTNDLYRQGQVAANDRLAVEVQRKGRELSLIKANNARAIALAALNRLLGQALDSEVTLIDILGQPTWAGGIADATRLALLYRPDLAGARARIRAGQAGVRSAKASLLPRVYLFGDYSGTNDSRILNKTWAEGGVGVSFSIFDGGATMAQAGRALEELAQLEDAAADRLDQVRLEVRQAWLSLSSSRERVGVAESALKLAEDNLTRTQDRYRQGLASSTDVLADEDRLAQARFNHAEALYDQHIAYAELVHAIGIDPANPVPEKQP